MDELINNEMIYEIEELIVDDIDKRYHTKYLRILSKELTQKFGKGFSKSNLNNIINFYLTYGSVQTLLRQLG